MVAEAETKEQTVVAGGARGADRKVAQGADKVSMEAQTDSKPVPGSLTDDEIASILAAASEKLQAAPTRDRKKPEKGVARCLRALYPKRLLGKLRDFYINTCMIAAEKGDFVDLVAGHPGMYYGETVMSRNISQRRDREHEEMMQASLSRQVSISLSRQLSKQSESGPLKMTRNTSTGIPGVSRSGSVGIPDLSRNGSTGIPGLSRQVSTGVAGLNRQASTGISGLNRNPSTGLLGLNGNFNFGRNTAGRNSGKSAESSLFSEGREKFLQERALDLSTLKDKRSKVAGATEFHSTNAGKVDVPGKAVMADEANTPVK